MQKKISRKIVTPQNLKKVLLQYQSMLSWQFWLETLENQRLRMEDQDPHETFFQDLDLNFMEMIPFLQAK